MLTVFEYWAGRKGLKMWAVTHSGYTEVSPFDTEQAERLTSRPDYAGCVHHLDRNPECYIVTVEVRGKKVTVECSDLDEAVSTCAELSAKGLRDAV